MIKEAEEFDRYIGIAGFKDVHIGNVDDLLNLIRKRLGAQVNFQLFDAKLVAGWRHLYFATLNGLKAFKNGTNISKNIAVECLLYASAERQIRVAFDLIGIRENLSRTAALLLAKEKTAVERSLAEISKSILGERDDHVLDLSNDKMAYIRQVFGISDTELATKAGEDGEEKALCDLVIERGALLVTRR